MEVKFKHIFIAFGILLIILFYSLYNIFTFMPLLSTCNDDFEIINKCGCVPPSWSSYQDNPIKNQQLNLNMTELIKQDG